MFICPVPKCHKNLYTKKSLTNHLRNTKDILHSEYYCNHVKRKNCSKCGRLVDNRSKNKEICWTCLQVSTPNKKVIIKEWLHRVCFKCRQPVYGLFSKMNTRVLCDTCVKNKIDRKKEYNRVYDEERYLRLKSERELEKIKKGKDLEVSLIHDLKDDLLNFDLPIHVVCTKHNISLPYIKKAAKKLLTEEEYIRRKFNCRHKAGLLVGELHKKRWQQRKRPSARKKLPNKLELLFGAQISTEIPFSAIRYNVWKTIKDVNKNVYIHLETDLAINVCGTRVCLLCDGVVFHGRNSLFCGDTVDIDEYKGRLLNTANPFVLRYSELEIKNGWAVKNLKSIVCSIQKGILTTYYRNWMV